MLSRLASRRSVPAEPAAASPASPGASGSPGLAEPPFAFGLLASFAPETPDTIALLRTYRAGCRPVRKEGFLSKRKRKAWREHAPLGPLAWKKRYFVLEPTQLVYFAPKGADNRAVLKGVVPLTGWVEVSRAGPDAGPVSPSVSGDATTRPFSFVVRTGKTNHVFHAASQAEADEWIAAIAINAQHLGAAQDDPQCVIVPSMAEARALADTVMSRLRNLQASMGAGGGGDDGVVVELDVGGGGGGAGGGDEDADMELLLALQASEAAAAAEEEDDNDDEADDGSRPRAATSAGDSSGAGGGANVTLAEAQALAEAMGGVTMEFLQQLPPDVAAQLASAAGLAPPVAAAAAAPQRPQAAVTVASPRNAPLPGPPGAFVAQMPAFALQQAPEAAWTYLDIRDRPIGPVPESHMRALLYGGAFQPRTLVRCMTPAAGLDASTAAAVDAYGVAQVFLPLSTLFPDPAGAFVGDGRWVAAYCAATQYQSLLTHAITLGLPRVHVVPALLYMEREQIPAELGILLDILGVQDLASVAAPRSAASSSGGGHGGAGDAASGGAPAPAAAAGASSGSGADTAVHTGAGVAAAVAAAGI
jgi:hypothetical protein